MYELHLTTRPIAADNLPAFIELCKGVGATALIVELAHGRHRVQPMLTLKCDRPRGELSGGVDHLATQMDAHGYEVIRCKVEVDLAETGPAILDNAAYLEWHGRSIVLAEELVDLSDLCAVHDGHLSRNTLHETNRRYITLRAADHASLAEKVRGLVAALSRGGWTVEKQRWESVLHDSNILLDHGWLKETT
jgi:hypothetical protein